jgi:hypothetical protein
MSYYFSKPTAYFLKTFEEVKYEQTNFDRPFE